MSEINELDTYIRLMDLQLEHPFRTEIPITNGSRDSAEEFVFGITPSIYKKLEQIRGEYNFKFGDQEYACNIVYLTRNQVRLRIEDFDTKRIKNGAITVDTSNITEREKRGLQQLKEENFSEKRYLLFGNREISGGDRSECIFEEDLNDEQKCAVEYAVGVRDVYLVWGPPGTGKTAIVPEIVRNYSRLHKDTNPKILVCSYRNRAVDNVVMKLFDNKRFKKSSSGLGTPRLRANTKMLFLMNNLKRSEKR
jgi:Cdc6-like AAA superfamily ATPase